MNKKSIAKIVKTAESVGWNVEYDENDFTFSKSSPAGQDFNIEITASTIEELIENLYDRDVNFDCSEEAYLWLDDTGHGTNGAPYDMKDVYEDMEACSEMLTELYEAF